MKIQHVVIVKNNRGDRFCIFEQIARSLKRLDFDVAKEQFIVENKKRMPIAAMISHSKSLKGWQRRFERQIAGVQVSKIKPVKIKKERVLRGELKKFLMPPVSANKVLMFQKIRMKTNGNKKIDFSGGTYPISRIIANIADTIHNHLKV